MEDRRNRLINFILENEVNFIVGCIMMLGFSLRPGNSEENRELLCLIVDMCIKASSDGVICSTPSTELIEIVELEFCDCKVICFLAIHGHFEFLKAFTETRINEINNRTV